MGSHLRLLLPFVLCFLLPTVLVQLAELLGLAWWSMGQDPFIPPGPHPHHHHHHHHAHFHHKMGGAYPPIPSGRTLAIMLAVGLVMWLLASLAVASIAKAVQYIYSDNDDESAVTSIFKSLPSALFRLFMTSLWIFLLTLATIFTVSLPFYLLEKLFHHASLFATMQQVFLSVALTILSFLFLLSQEVAVLEPENYGLAALKKSSKLVQEKFLASLILFLVSVGVGAALSKLSTSAGSFSGKLPQWAMYLLAVLLALLYLAYMVYILLTTVVLYFSSKLQYDAEDESLPQYRGGDNPYTPLVVPAET